MIYNSEGMNLEAFKTVPMILLKPVTHDWGTKVPGERVFLTPEEADYFEKHGLARRLYEASLREALVTVPEEIKVQRIENIIKRKARPRKAKSAPKTK